MSSLASHPEHVHGDGRYQFLPPLRRYLLKGSDARASRIGAVRAVGWQYLISDHGGFAVVDLSDDIPETYGSVRRGPFADRYEENLRRIADLETTEETPSKLSALEVPQYGTSAFVLDSNEGLIFFIVSLHGILQSSRETDRSTFFEELLKPSPPPKRNTENRFDGPII